jgi:hypothetical protein
LSLPLELAARIDGIPEPTPGPLSADLLDALLAALTAVAYTRGRYRALGAADEGQLILPLILPLPVRARFRARFRARCGSGIGAEVLEVGLKWAWWFADCPAVGWVAFGYMKAPLRDCTTPLIRLYTLVSRAGHSLFVGTWMPLEPHQPGGRGEAENAQTRRSP